jgi:hypothetical protein
MDPRLIRTLRLLILLCAAIFVLNLALVVLVARTVVPG